MTLLRSIFLLFIVVSTATAFDYPPAPWPPQPFPLNWEQFDQVRWDHMYRIPHIGWSQDWETQQKKMDPNYKYLYEHLRKEGVYYNQNTLFMNDNDMGFLAPIQHQPNGDVIVFGARNKSKHVLIPYIVRYDKDLNIVWERYYQNKRVTFKTYEAGIGSVCPDGKTMVHIAYAYFPANWDYVGWVTWMDMEGKILREFTTPGKGMAESPVPAFAQLTQSCGLSMGGYVIKSNMNRRKDIAHRWHARYNSHGALLLDSTFHPSDDPDWVPPK